MTYQRQRRAKPVTEADLPPMPEATAYPVDEDGDRIYAEEDYAVAAQDASPMPAAEPLQAEESAFVPEDATYTPGTIPYATADVADQADAPVSESFDPFNIPEYTPVPQESAYHPLLDDTGDLYGDPLDEELLTEEELAALRRSRWKLIAGMGDFIGIIVGTAAILLLVLLLVSLVNWLLSDIDQTFALWQTRI